MTTNNTAMNTIDITNATWFRNPDRTMVFDEMHDEIVTGWKPMHCFAWSHVKRTICKNYQPVEVQYRMIECNQSIPVPKDVDSLMTAIDAIDQVLLDRGFTLPTPLKAEIINQLSRRFEKTIWRQDGTYGVFEEWPEFVFEKNKGTDDLIDVSYHFEWKGMHHHDDDRITVKFYQPIK